MRLWPLRPVRAPAVPQDALRCALENARTQDALGLEERIRRCPEPSCERCRDARVVLRWLKEPMDEESWP